MKRRRFQSIALIPKCGYVAICEEGRGWVFTFDDPKWRKLLELPPIEEPPNTGLVTREEYVKDYDRRHGTDLANSPASFFDPSLGQPWPEDQASDRPAVRPRQIIYQHVVGQCIAGGGGGSPEPIPYQGLGRQDLPVRDWANLAGKVDRAEMALLNSITNTSIDVGCVLLSLIGEIRDELGLPKPGEAAQ
jgi:hypothetical protein